MISPLRRFLAVGLLTLAGSVLAQDPKFSVFLCLGQSNMEGFPGLPAEEKTFSDARFQMLAAVDFPDLKREKGQWYTAVPPLSRSGAGLGPADYFGRTLIERLPADERVGVINVSVAGARIEVYDKDNIENFVANAPHWMRGSLASYGNNPYARAVELAKQAQKTGVIRGILLHQGESNVNDREWPQKVKTLYENLLKDLGLTAEQVPLLVGEVVPQEVMGVAASMNEIIYRLPTVVPTAHVISATGCASLPDRLHFSPAGYRELGKRYGETMLRLLQTK